jgi:hypothetical protein
MTKLIIYNINATTSPFIVHLPLLFAGRGRAPLGEFVQCRVEGGLPDQHMTQ